MADEPVVTSPILFFVGDMAESEPLRHTDQGKGMANEVLKWIRSQNVDSENRPLNWEGVELSASDNLQIPKWMPDDTGQGDFATTEWRTFCGRNYCCRCRPHTVMAVLVLASRGCA